MYLLPEGRELSRLREKQQRQFMLYNNKTLVLNAKRAEVKELQSELEKKKKAVAREYARTQARRASVISNDSADAELRILQSELQSKQKELKQMEQELLFSY